MQTFSVQRYIHAGIAVVLAVLMLAHVNDPQRWLWMGIYLSGALLALTICKRHLHLWTLRILAIAATMILFAFAFGFFSRAPHLGPEWYQSGHHTRTLAMLVAMFCMVAVVSAYTCRMKRDHGDYGEEYS